MNLWELPLSAYTPGQGDPSMEGGWQTSTGAPMYTLEMYLNGTAPYVTGATSMKQPSRDVVFRTIGDRVVPVRATDYGPGVKGLDIATENTGWARNFPYQGSRDNSALGRYGTMMAGQGNAAPPPAPAPQRFAGSSDGMSATQFANQSFGPAGGLATANALAAPSATQTAASALGAGLSSAGGMMQKQGQQGMQQAMALLQTAPNPLKQLLAQLVGNPTMYLQQQPIPG